VNNQQAARFLYRDVLFYIFMSNEQYVWRKVEGILLYKEKIP